MAWTNKKQKKSNYNWPCQKHCHSLCGPAQKKYWKKCEVVSWTYDILRSFWVPGTKYTYMVGKQSAMHAIMSRPLLATTATLLNVCSRWWIPAQKAKQWHMQAVQAVNAVEGLLCKALLTNSIHIKLSFKNKLLARTRWNIGTAQGAHLTVW